MYIILLGDNMASYILSSEKEIIKDISNKIKKKRISLNISQEYVSKKTGLSMHTISNIESGKSFTIESLIKVMQVLGIVENLKGLIDDPVLGPDEIHMPYEKQRVKNSKKKEENSTWEWGQ